MNTQPVATKTQSKWSKRMKAAVASLALAGVLFSGAAAVNTDSNKSDEAARISVQVSISASAQGLTWS